MVFNWELLATKIVAWGYFKDANDFRYLKTKLQKL